MKKITNLKSIVVVCFVLLSLGFSSKDSSTNNNFCGPVFFADNSAYYGPGSAPEMGVVRIQDEFESEAYFVCCGNDGFLQQWGGSIYPYKITVEVENDWSGYGTRYIGIRYYGGATIQWQQYYYGQGIYIFYLTAGCTSYEMFVSSSY